MPPDADTPRLRVATQADAEAIADLHTRSWRSAYRGSFSDAYLDGPIEAERRAFWRERSEHPRAGLWTLVAEDRGGAMLGFVCCLEDHDPHWGSLIDNLHVDPAGKGQGIGRLLMRGAGERLFYALPRRPVYLFVLQSNQAADAFYRRLGGVAAETLAKTEPDGTRLPVIRYAWPSAAAFVTAVG